MRREGEWFSTLLFSKKGEKLPKNSENELKDTLKELKDSVNRRNAMMGPHEQVEDSEEVDNPSIGRAIVLLLLVSAFMGLLIMFVWNYTIADLSSSVEEITFLQSGALYLLLQLIWNTLPRK